MKKLVSIILALALCLSTVAAIAEAVPSITTADLIELDEQIEGLELAVAEDQSVAEAELEKLAAADSVKDYFGVEEAEGKNVDEFFALEVIEYPAELELIPITIGASREYEEGEEVIVLVGIPDEENNVAWSAFTAVAESNKVTFEVTPEFAEIMKATTPIIAILSK